jgi:hypothetical protein
VRETIGGYNINNAIAATSNVKKDFTDTITTDTITSGSVHVTNTLQSTRNGAYLAYINKHIGTENIKVQATVHLDISDDANFAKDVTSAYPTWDSSTMGMGYGDDNTTNTVNIGSIQDITSGKIIMSKTFGSLNSQKTYYLRFMMEDENGNDISVSNTASFSTTSSGTPNPTSNISTNNSLMDFNCGFGVALLGGSDSSITGCVAEISYNVFFKVASEIAYGTARMLDFFVYYSTNSASYTNDFVNQAFAAIRDIANIFFIIALLYVAIKTILDIGVTNSKKTIGVIIIVALLINFSLFFTEVIIDGTNILAKVFYNQTSGVDKNGNVVTAGGGETSISVGLVDKVDPEKILMAGAGAQNQQDYYTGNKGQFIFLTLLAAGIVFYMAYVFFMVALLFVGRVVALWLAMIFAPLAFASYTMPFNMPGFGHKDWWDSLLKNAFLAPIFIFFLYIIIMFAGFLTTIITYNPGEDTMQQVMAVIIPFAILMILLMQAKKIAVEFSGEIGKAITGLVKTVGGFVGGAALGVATGGVAMLGQATIGKHYQNIANDEELRKRAAGGDKNAQGKIDRANIMAKKSFDVRQTLAGKAFQKQTGLNLNAGVVGAVGLGTEKTKGGQKAAFERKVEKEEERVKSYEMTPAAERAQNQRNEQFKADKESAKVVLNTEGGEWENKYEKEKKEAEEKEETPERKAYQKDYAIKLAEAKANKGMGAFSENNEKEFKENYEKQNGKLPMSSFNEKKFRKEYEEKNPTPETKFETAYVNGEDLSKYNLPTVDKMGNNVVRGRGSVETPADINKERREAYAFSLEHQNHKRDKNGNWTKDENNEFMKKDIKDFLSQFGSEMRNMMRPGGGVSTTLLTAGLAVPFGGLVNAIKATIPANKELVGRISKGKSTEKKLLNLMQMIGKEGVKETDTLKGIKKVLEKKDDGKPK